MYRFNGFTEKANTALNLAIQSAEEMGHSYIGTEHIVLGLLKEGTGVAASVLNKKGITTERFEEAVLTITSSGPKTSLDTNDFTPRSKRTLEMAMADAEVLKMGYVGTEHLLLAIAQDSSSYSAKILAKMGLDTDSLMEALADAMQVSAP